MRGKWAVLAGVVAAALCVGVRPGHAAPVTQDVSFTAPDGIVLHAQISGEGGLEPRPLIVEDSPYAPDVSTLGWVGSTYNTVELQWRGTGLSGGALDSTGAQDQSDLAAFLGWACTQPWSDGSIGLYGFSASAIVVYNTLHLPLPCVKAAALMAGSVDLYRDLLYIGGIPNLVPGLVVEADIGEPALQDGPMRFQQEPQTIPDAVSGFVTTPLNVAMHQQEDEFWNERTFQGDASQIPILADTSFYDVEPRGPFMAYNATKQYGSHLLVYGAHDGFPAGTPGPFPQYKNWFDHYLLGEPLSDANQPPVSLYESNGSREQFLAGNVTHLTGASWPLPDTAWTNLYLSVAKSGSAGSLNDGTLSPSPQQTSTTQAYPFVPTDPTEVDLHTIGVVGSDGLDQAATNLPALTNMQITEPTSLTFTTPPLQRPIDVAGPASLDVWVGSAQPVTDLYVVIADVWPDGTAYPVATGALRTAYPDVIRSRSLVDPAGELVDPYADFSFEAPSSATREYHVEILPMGNHFGLGHRIRAYLVGTPLTQFGSLPGVNTVSLGGVTSSRLILPTVGGFVNFAG
jgi:putative CocE/NonD family hydrolase